MNLSTGMLSVLTIVVLAVFLADIRRIIKDHLAYRLVWGAALAVTLGCGFILG